jgi:dienelactone hydrolase
VDEWRVRARGQVSALLAAPGGAAAPAARCLRAFAADGVAGEEIEWDLLYGPPVRGLLLKPAGAVGRLPAVLALHDHSGDKYFGWEKVAVTDRTPHAQMAAHYGTCYGGRAWANELARRGYVVLAHDSFLFGSRRVHPGDMPPDVVARMVSPPLGALDPAAREGEPYRPEMLEVSTKRETREIRAYNVFAGQHEHIVAKSLFSAGTTWPGVFLSEDQAALGLLCARPDVDPERVGCCGLSGGGLRSNYLAAMDSRINCSVTVGFMTTWRDLVLNVSHAHTWMTYIPGLPRLMDFPDILSMHAPRPALVLQTRGDPLFTVAEAERCDRVLGECYAKAGAPEAFRMSFHDGPHKFDVPMQEEAFAWLERWMA